MFSSISSRSISFLTDTNSNSNSNTNTRDSANKPGTKDKKKVDQLQHDNDTLYVALAIAAVNCCGAPEIAKLSMVNHYMKDILDGENQTSPASSHFCWDWVAKRDGLCPDDNRLGNHEQQQNARNNEQNQLAGHDNLFFDRKSYMSNYVAMKMAKAYVVGEPYQKNASIFAIGFWSNLFFGADKRSLPEMFPEPDHDGQLIVCTSRQEAENTAIEKLANFGKDNIQIYKVLLKDSRLSLTEHNELKNNKKASIDKDNIWRACTIKTASINKGLSDPPPHNAHDLRGIIVNDCQKNEAEASEPWVSSGVNQSGNDDYGLPVETGHFAFHNGN